MSSIQIHVYCLIFYNEIFLNNLLINNYNVIYLITINQLIKLKNQIFM